jgi:hypothetical protein
MHSRKMSEKPLIHKRIKQQRLAYARDYENWVWRTESRRCSLMRATLIWGLATRTPAAGEEKVQTATPPCQATRKGDGLGMLQLDRERRPGVPGEGQDDEWDQVQDAADWEEGVLYDTAWHLSLSIGWGPLVTAWFIEGPHIMIIKWSGNSPDLTLLRMSGLGWRASSTTATPPKWSSKRQRPWSCGSPRCRTPRAGNLVECMPRRLQMGIEKDAGSRITKI